MSAYAREGISVVAAQRVPRLFSVEVNPAYCKGCEICIQVCPKDVLRMNDLLKAEAFDVKSCTGCISCVIYCPDFAIKVEEVEVNE